MRITLAVTYPLRAIKLCTLYSGFDWPQVNRGFNNDGLAQRQASQNFYI